MNRSHPESRRAPGTGPSPESPLSSLSEQQRPHPGPPDELATAAVRAIRRGLAHAASPLEVYRRALARVMPLLGADFASIFLRDDANPALLRLACAQNWPQSSARFLSKIRIREGCGPTGRAVRQARPVEVMDVFGNPGMEDWWEPARELGFVAMTAHPLMDGGRVVGSISFYFADRRRFEDRDRTFLATTAREIARAAAEVGKRHRDDLA